MDRRPELATLADLSSLVALDGVCFPRDDPHRHPAAEGEFEAGVRQGKVLVTHDDRGLLTGFLQYHAGDRGDLFLLGVGVAPEHRGRGLATALVQHFLSATGVTQGKAQVATTVSPANLPMLRVCFRCGFLASDYLDDYFGPTEDRLYLRAPLTRSLTSDDSLLLPVGALHLLREYLQGPAYVLAAIADLANGSHFELRRYGADDPALQANESSASISLTGTLLASATFLTGFGLAGNSRVPVDLLAHLALSLVALMIALLVYANSSGELARLRLGRFDRYMTAGNVISEFGGVYPFLHVVPTELARITDSVPAGGLTALGASLGIFWYHRSGFAIVSRYPLNRFVRGFLLTYLTVSPLLGFSASRIWQSTTAWTIVNVTVLLGGALLLLRRGEHPEVVGQSST